MDTLRKASRGIVSNYDCRCNRIFHLLAKPDKFFLLIGIVIHLTVINCVDIRADSDYDSFSLL